MSQHCYALFYEEGTPIEMSALGTSEALAYLYISHEPTELIETRKILVAETAEMSKRYSLLCVRADHFLGETRGCCTGFAYEWLYN